MPLYSWPNPNETASYNREKESCVSRNRLKLCFRSDIPESLTLRTWRKKGREKEKKGRKEGRRYTYVCVHVFGTDRLSVEYKHRAAAAAAAAAAARSIMHAATSAPLC